MNRKIKLIALVSAAAITAMLLLASCSGDLESEADTTESDESQSAEIGHEAAGAIRVPLESTQDAVDRENERMREYEKRLNE